MTDRYTKIILTVIAINMTLLVVDSFLEKFIPNAWAETMKVYVNGGTLDYETDVTGGNTLYVFCKNC